MGYVGTIKCLYQLSDSEAQIIPSLLRAVISPVKSDAYFENESKHNKYRRICEINDHVSYFHRETSYLNLNDSPDCFKMRIFFSLHLIN